MLKQFRIYPEAWNHKKYFFVSVKVFSKRSIMAKSITEYMEGKPDKHCEGQCSGHSVYDKRGKLTGKFATMWINAEDLKAHGAEIVSHECVHAAMRHITNKKIDLSDMAGEEVLCYCVGSLTQQLTDRLHKIGVWDMRTM